MAKKLQILRGTTAQNDAYTGSVGELTMDTEKVEVRIHDGTTQGGKIIGSSGGSMPDRYVESINGWTGNVFLGAHEIGTYTSDEIDEKIAEVPEILPILFHTWSDCIMNDQSWLRADMFSWHSGDTYKSAYESIKNGYYSLSNEVLYAYDDEYDGVLYLKTSTPSIGDQLFDGNGEPANKDYGGWFVREIYSDGSISYDPNTPDTRYYRNASKDIALSMPASTTETINGITISFYRAEDGRKICLPDQETKVQELYNSTGVAWYYILDTENKQFKLPRTKFGFTGLRDSVGGYVEAGLPNIKGQMKGGLRCYETNGAFKTLSNYNTAPNDYDYGSVEAVEFDASRSSSVYGNSDTVQPPATQMYLYFYVGNFEQSAIEQTAGLNAELFNGKADVNLNNTPFASLDNDGGILKWNGASVIAPAGIVSAFAGKTAPSGWLKCDGSAVSRTRYADLFAAIGTTYGAGDGSTTFNLPTLETREIVQIQKASESNGWIWYRLYSDGWVEQGRSATITGGTNVQVQFQVNMADVNYDINLSQYNTDPTGVYNQLQFHSKTTNSMVVISTYGQSKTDRPFAWSVRGYSYLAPSYKQTIKCIKY